METTIIWCYADIDYNLQIVIEEQKIGQEKMFIKETGVDGLD